jgi:hypothetical protein
MVDVAGCKIKKIPNRFLLVIFSAEIFWFNERFHHPRDQSCCDLVLNFSGATYPRVAQQQYCLSKQARISSIRSFKPYAFMISGYVGIFVQYAFEGKN